MLYPYKRGGGCRQSFSRAEGGFEIVLTWELEVLAMLIEAQQVFTL